MCVGRECYEEMKNIFLLGHFQVVQRATLFCGGNSEKTILDPVVSLSVKNLDIWHFSNLVVTALSYSQSMDVICWSCGPSFTKTGLR